VLRPLGGVTMHRRKFIALAGGAAVAWPRTAQAQQTTMPVIGFLSATSPEANTVRANGFRQGLKESGLIEGENVAIEYRWAHGDNRLLPDLAADLVRRRVNVLAAVGSIPLALAAKAATATIPVVFAVGEDPARLGLVESLARPGGNITGINLFNSELIAKRLGLLRELLPAAKRMVLLVNPTDARATETNVRDVAASAPNLGFQVQQVDASTGHDIDAAFAAFAHDRPDALFVAGNIFFNSRRTQLALLAARHAIPASYGSRDYPEYGGLMSYGSNLTEAFRQAGVYAGRILKGAKPANLPVVQADKFELVINAQAARVLGVTISPSLLARADEVID
jgi:putative tryptophan/tyrosine transport system substrate-binding protein